MKKILVLLIFTTSIFARTLFIEGLDNKFTCDGKQSSGGGFQKCGKITALKPLTLCFSSPSGMKCQKLEANETLDTEVDTKTTENSKEEKKEKKNTQEKTTQNNTNETQNESEVSSSSIEDTPIFQEPKETNEISTINSVEIKTEINIENQVASVSSQNNTSSDSSINLGALFNLGTISSTVNGTAPDYEEPIYIYSYADINAFGSISYDTDKYFYDNSYSGHLLYNQFDPEVDFYGLVERSPENIISKTDIGVHDPSSIIYTNTSDFDYYLVLKRFEGSLLNSLINRESLHTYTFEGEVIGNVLTPSNTYEQIIMNDSSNELILNFKLGAGNNNMDGTLKFETENTQWDVNLSSNSINSYEFSGDITSGTTQVDSGSFDAVFIGDTRAVENDSYTDDISDVGGIFSILDSIGNRAGGLLFATNTVGDIPTFYNYTLDGYRIRIDTSGNIIEENIQSNYQIIYDLDDNPLMEDDVSWGYWNETDDLTSITTKYSQVRGLKTSTTIMDNILDINTASQTFTFNGGVIGIVFTAIDPDNPPLLTVGERAPNIEDINIDATNSLQMAFDLGGGTNSMTGTMEFTTASTSWNVNLSSSHAQITNSGFTGDITSGDTIVTSGSLEGNFFGRDEIQSVGGKFDITNSNGDIAAGVLKATVQ